MAGRPDGAGVVVVGGGQAGHSVAATLRSAGYDGPVTVFADERHRPYQRPPLSKKLLTAPEDVRAELVPESFYRERDIDLRLSDGVAAIDTAARAVTTRTGLRLRYDELVLATGARNRPLPVPGAGLDRVHALRSVDDALAIGRALTAARDVVVVGGGFIGLELAQVAVAHGARVTVVEVAGRLLGRAVSPQLAEHVRERHERGGVRILTGTTVHAVGGADRVRQVVTDRGTLPADLVVYGIGAAPRDELARAAGLAVDGGVVVDERLRSVSDPRVSAVGDCARHPHPRADGLVRLESVQNATDQGALVGRRIAGGTGAPDPRYESLPWFWSDQGLIKLQIAGLRASGDDVHLAPGDSPDRLAAYAFRDDRLVAVETLNWPAEHLAARRLLERDAEITAADLAGSTLGARSRPACHGGAGMTASAQTWFGAHLAASAAEAGSRPALVFGDRSWTYAELDLAIRRTVGRLDGFGVRRGDRVVMQGAARPEALITLFAVTRMGAVLVPVHPQATGGEVAVVCEETAPRAVVVEDGFPDVSPVLGRRLTWDELHPDDEPSAPGAEPGPPTGSDVAIIAFTSGTSGRPKGVALTHDNLHWSMVGGLARLPFGTDDVALVSTPLAHVAVLGGLPQCTWARRGTVILAPRFDPGLFVDLVRDHRVTCAFAVPAMAALLVRHPRFASGDLDTLRWILSGGFSVKFSVLMTSRSEG